MDFYEAEALDGVRFTWNTWPTSRLEASRCVIPFGCVYTPLKKVEGLQVLPYEPVCCKACRAILNPFCQVDYNAKIWRSRVCAFCNGRNQFPPQYADINEQNLPAELIQQYSTIEYQYFFSIKSQLHPQHTPMPPIFVFVVDVSARQTELDALKDSLEMALNLIPEDCLVGLITTGTVVQLYELGNQDCNRAYVFRGNKEYNAKKLQEMLDLGSSGGQTPHGIGVAGSERFLSPLSECLLNLQGILEELQHDTWPVPGEKRPLRSTGAAMSVAVSLLEATYPGRASKIVSFIGGAATQGPGQVVSDDLNESIRSHQDIEKGAKNSRFLNQSCEFYDRLALQCCKSGISVDLFAFALDQIGVKEMKHLIHRTGGNMVMGESFTHQTFKDSFRQLFRRDEDDSIDLNFQATLEAFTSREYKISGALGPCASTGQKSPYAGETEIGEAGTSSWKFSSLTSTTSVGIYFEIVNQHAQPIPAGQYRYLQFVTRYQTFDGQQRVRVSTIANPWADASQVQEIAAGFDQEAAAALLTRQAIYKCAREEPGDVLRWLDRQLIRLMGKFAEYHKEDVSSFRLSQNFTLFPQFLYHLRRSPFLQIFNSSPDETECYRMIFDRETVSNCMIMIQPTLVSYSLQAPPEPVLLDAESIMADRILLLDTFFQVVIFHGKTIADWRDQGYQHDPQHHHFKQMLEQPQEDANAIIEDRFPVPRLVVCDQYKSQARYLLSKVNPSVTHTSGGSSFGGAGEGINTDDASLEVFMEHLKKLAVSS